MSLIAYGLMALAVIGAAAGLYGTVHHSGVAEGRAEVQKSWDAANELARKRAIAKDAENKQAKEKADAKNAKSRSDLDSLYAAYRSLRDQPRHGSLLPAAAPGAASPATACFDRAAFDRGMETADGILQDGAERILKRGDAAIVDLDDARRWAQR